MRSSVDRLRVTAGTALALAIPFTVAVWWETPNLSVEVNRGHAVVHMEVLGEYPADIRSIEISSDGLGTPVWKIVTTGNLFQVNSVALQVGPNAGNIKPSWGKSVEIAPGPDSTFRLDADRSYRVRICPPALVGLCRATAFVLTNP